MIAYTFYELDNRVKRYAETLAARGDHVDVIALLNPNNNNQSLSHEKLNGVNLYRIQKRTYNEKNKFTYLFRLLSFFIKSICFVTAKYIKNHYKIIHVHTIPDFEVFAAIIPKLFGAKVILDIHDIVPELYLSKFKQKKDSIIYSLLLIIEKISIAFSNKIIIANHIWEKTLISRAVDKDKCIVLMNYPDPNIFYKRENKKKVQDKFIVIYPGTLNWHQGLDIAIKAFSLIKNKNKKIELHIYGDGPEKVKLISLVHDLKLEKTVKIFNFLPLEKIAEVISNANLGIVPKRKDSFGNEAFSTKILEFMSLGIPVLVADTKIDKYYFNDSNIVFFTSGDMKELCNKLLYIISNISKRNELIQNGLKMANSYNWDRYKHIYLNLVDKLAEKQSIM